MKNIKLAKLFIGVAVVVTLIINMVAVLLPLNGISTAAVSDKFKVMFVPANYVFSIWSVIYLGLIAFTVYQYTLKEKEYAVVNKLFPYFLIAGLANSAWLFTWHYGVYYWGLVLMIVLMLSLIMGYLEIVNFKGKTTPKYTRLLIKLPISIYLGWISVATIANVTDVLYLLKWDALGIPGSTWSALMILIAAVLGLFMLIKQKDYAYVAVLVWALIGIAVKFPESVEILAAVMLGCFAMCSVTVGYLLKDLGVTDKKKK